MSDLRKNIEDAITAIATTANLLPHITIIHNIQQGFRVEYMSDRGVELLGFTLEELQALGSAYHEKFFNPEESRDYIRKIQDMLYNRDERMIVSFFQQVKRPSDDCWTWYMSTIRILLKTPDGAPLLTVTTAFPIDPEHQITTKVARLLEENNFLRKNSGNFARLSQREREILKLMALGNGSQEISEQLFIPLNTVKTHRKNIYQKLSLKNTYDLNAYARAFDLI